MCISSSSPSFKNCSCPVLLGSWCLCYWFAFCCVKNLLIIHLKDLLRIFSASLFMRYSNDSWADCITGTALPAESAKTVYHMHSFIHSSEYLLSIYLVPCIYMVLLRSRHLNSHPCFATVHVPYRTSSVCELAGAALKGPQTRWYKQQEFLVSQIWMENPKPRCQQGQLLRGLTWKWGRISLILCLCPWWSVANPWLKDASPHLYLHPHTAFFLHACQSLCPNSHFY